MYYEMKIKVSVRLFYSFSENKSSSYINEYSLFKSIGACSVRPEDQHTDFFFLTADPHETDCKACILLSNFPICHFSALCESVLPQYESLYDTATRKTSA